MLTFGLHLWPVLMVRCRMFSESSCCIAMVSIAIASIAIVSVAIVSIATVSVTIVSVAIVKCGHSKYGHAPLPRLGQVKGVAPLRGIGVEV